MIAAALATAAKFLREHKQLVLFAGAILAVFSSGYCAGRRSVRQPAVHEAVQAHAKADAAAAVQQTVNAGPWTVKTWDFACPSVDHVSAPVIGAGAPGTRHRVVVAQDRVPTAAGADRAGEEGPQDAEHDGSLPPGQLIRYTEEVHDATTTETHAQVATHEEATRKLDLTVSPAAAIPRVSAFWLPEVSPGLAFGVVGVDVRLTDRVSVMAGTQPFAAGGPTYALGARVGIW